jgi:hypothetical protein
MSVFKRFRLTEFKSLALRWEVFNVFNRANFGNPARFLQQRSVRPDHERYGPAHHARAEVQLLAFYIE